MANINTKRKRKANEKSAKRGYPLNTSALRKESGKNAYEGGAREARRNGIT